MTHNARRFFGPLIAMVALFAMVVSSNSIGTRTAHAVPQFSSTRVYYQPFANTLWGTWSGNTCPAGARYSVNYGCVYANSVSSHSTLRYTNLDGSGTTDINISCAAGSNPHWQAPWNGVNKIVVDEVNGKIYWENSFEPGIARSNLDGTGCELIANGGYYNKGMIALDSTGTYLYSIQNNTIRRVTIADGTVTTLSFTGQGITVTGLGDMVVHNGKLYVAINNSGSAGHIMEATLDTSSATQTARLIVTGQSVGMNGIDVDAVNNKIYWATGSAVKRANLDGTSIETVYSGSVNFVQVLPTENLILMGLSGNNNMFTTNLAGGNVTSLNVKAGGYVTAVATNVAPPTTTTTSTTSTSTTTTSTSTTTTTVPVSSTTVAPPTTVTGLPTTSTTVVNGTSNSSNVTTTTIASVVSSTSSTTTTTSTTTTVPPAPEVQGGEGTVLVDGKETAVEVSRQNNKFTIKAGSISASLTGLTSDGQVAPLDEDGAVRLSDEDLFVVTTEGFEANSNVEVWMYSTPRKMGSIKVDDSGSANERFSVPNDIEEGMHRVILRGQDSQGKDVEVAFGMYVGFESGTSTAAKILIAVPIALAILLALLIPTALRRRREDQPA